MLPSHHLTMQLILEQLSMQTCYFYIQSRYFCRCSPHDHLAYFGILLSALFAWYESMYHDCSRRQHQDSALCPAQLLQCHHRRQSSITCITPNHVQVFRYLQFYSLMEYKAHFTISPCLNQDSSLTFSVCCDICLFPKVLHFHLLLAVSCFYHCIADVFQNNIVKWCNFAGPNCLVVAHLIAV